LPRQILRLISTKFYFGWEPPKTSLGELRRSPDPLPGLKGPTSKGGNRTGEGKERRGKEREERERNVSPLQ